LRDQRDDRTGANPSRRVSARSRLITPPPTPETRQKLYDELDYQRAVQAVIWAEPAINSALFRQAMEVVGTPIQPLINQINAYPLIDCAWRP
jgi:hypothetical protein